MNEKEINNITKIVFGSEMEIPDAIYIRGDPKEYIEYANKFNNLREIIIGIDKDENYYDGLKEFIGKCNDNVVIKNLTIGEATKEEFFIAEEKIDKIVNEIDRKWNEKEKLAFVNYKIGQLFSYSPNFNFSEKAQSKEVEDSRNIWKSLVNGRSVCNGIAGATVYILSKIGIKAKLLKSKGHQFVMAELEEGNVIMDPTWDLTYTLYEGKPAHFGKTYEQLRQEDGPFRNSHKLETIPENVIEIHDSELRQIHSRIGIAKEDGSFKCPVLKDLGIINQSFNTDKDKIEKFLEMFANKYNNQAKHLSETRNMLEICMQQFGFETNFNENKSNKDKIVTTKFVYKSSDSKCNKPYLILHFSSPELKDNIKILNLEERKIENLVIEEFEKQYMLHNQDTSRPFWKEYIKDRAENKRNKTMSNINEK